ATGWLAAHHGLRPQPFYAGAVFAAAGLLLSALVVRETKDHARFESTRRPDLVQARPRSVFWHTTFRDRNLGSVTEVGLVNNLNDAVAWGLFPILFAAKKLSIAEIGVVTAVYPTVWSVLQLVTGALSDRIGRKWLIVLGMWVQSLGIGVVALA